MCLGERLITMKLDLASQVMLVKRPFTKANREQYRTTADPRQECKRDLFGLQEMPAGSYSMELGTDSILACKPLMVYYYPSSDLDKRIFGD